MHELNDNNKSFIARRLTMFHDNTDMAPSSNGAG